MPNWCENDLYISGDPVVIEQLLDFMGPNFDFNNILPYPAEWKKRDEDSSAWFREHGWDTSRKMMLEKYGSENDGFNSGGYDWCVRNWGTKWRACEVSINDKRVTFQTAWSPPVPVIAALHKKFPTLTLSLEFFECGVGYSGGVTFYSKEDYYDEDKEWEPGIPHVTWEGEYHGTRGG